MVSKGWNGGGHGGVSDAWGVVAKAERHGGRHVVRVRINGVADGIKWEEREYNIVRVRAGSSSRAKTSTIHQRGTPLSSYRLVYATTYIFRFNYRTHAA
ncbi:hypothetical protein GOBAR_DD34824 [Gossypium barbadense]|nr:hypothetical protein GOBAR_DD34824 [Gossypium barbadense]